VPAIVASVVVVVVHYDVVVDVRGVIVVVMVVIPATAIGVVIPTPGDSSQGQHCRC
jgi:hypothetical protein